MARLGRRRLARRTPALPHGPTPTLARTVTRALAAALVVVSVGTGLSGCATWLDAGTVQTQQLLAAPPADLPRRVLLDATPFHPQTELQCGPAALATLLGAAGRPVTPEALTPEVFVPERGGSLQIEMLAATRRHDAVSTVLPPHLTALLQEVAAGHPVGVLLNLGLSFVPLWHFAVVVGFDIDREDVLLRSGQTRELRLPLRTFERTWARSQHWAFVTLPPETLPTTASLAAVREGRIGFERAAPPARAVAAWQSAWQRWPGDVVIGMGLGNSQAAAGDAPAALRTFAQVADATDSAAAWNNLASLRLQAGDLAGARQAARQAVLRASVAEPAMLSAAQATEAEVAAAGAR